VSERLSNTIELLSHMKTADIVSRPAASCHFPDWLADNTWRDVTGRHIYRVDDERQVLSEYYKSAGRVVPTKQHKQQQQQQRDDLTQLNEYRCLQSTEERRNDELVFISSTTNGW